jgi:hypothetical protein
MSPQSLTKIRKLFHLLIVVVYALGILKDKRLLYLCSLGLLILFSLVELVRFFRMPFAYAFIEQNMLIFLDEKDRNSRLVLSHIFLLFGLSYPIWVSSFKRNFVLLY